MFDKILPKYVSDLELVRWNFSLNEDNEDRFSLNEDNEDKEEGSKI